MRQRRRDTRREARWQTHRAQMQCKESQATIWHGEGQKSRRDQVHCRDAQTSFSLEITGWRVAQAPKHVRIEEKNQRLFSIVFIV